MGVLHIALHTPRGHAAVALHGVVEKHVLPVVRQAVARRVAPFPLADMVGYPLHLPAHAPCQAVLPAFPLAVVRQRRHPRFQSVARMLVVLPRA